MVKRNTSNIYVISGPSAVGKDTIIENLQKEDNNFHFVVTATTRRPRRNEKEGINHFFYSKETFNKSKSPGNVSQSFFILDLMFSSVLAKTVTGG